MRPSTRSRSSQDSAATAGRRGRRAAPARSPRRRSPSARPGRRRSPPGRFRQELAQAVPVRQGQDRRVGRAEETSRPVGQVGDRALRQLGGAPTPASRDGVSPAATAPAKRPSCGAGRRAGPRGPPRPARRRPPTPPWSLASANQGAAPRPPRPEGRGRRRRPGPARRRPGGWSGGRRARAPREAPWRRPRIVGAQVRGGPASSRPPPSAWARRSPSSRAIRPAVRRRSSPSAPTRDVVGDRLEAA